MARTRETQPSLTADELALERWEDEAPEVSTRPVDGPSWRTESDTLGPVRIPADRYWGPQTQRALQHFGVGRDRMPLEVFHAYAHVKSAAAIANAELGVLPAWRAAAIVRVCDEIIAGRLDEHFPLNVFQSGSGTQTNAAVNEIIANRGTQLLGGELGSTELLHPNDDVNRSQSSNDTFVTAMHVAAYSAVSARVVPALAELQGSLGAHAAEWAGIVKIGRTHLMDATPLTVGQEWSGYASALAQAIDDVERAAAGLLRVALGGTAVGTGINAPEGFTRRATQLLAESTQYPFAPAENPFAAQSTLDSMVRAHAALKGAAVTLFKVANDLRWLGSGPRQGLGELRLPANEPGSTIMPGKVNPSQAEVLMMACLEVFGHDTTITMAGAEGNFELNVFRPIVIRDFLSSAELLSDAGDNFRRFLVDGATVDRERLARNVEQSVMVVTALSPVIGYERAAEIVKRALADDLDVRAVALDMGVTPDVLAGLDLGSGRVGAG